MIDRSALAQLAAHRWTLCLMAVAAGLSVYLLPLPVSIFAALLAVIAVFIAVVDLEYFVIPDAANIALLLLGCILVLIEAEPGDHNDAFADALLRAIAGGGALYALRWIYLRRAGVEGLGLGDVKLAAVGALFLAWPTLPIALLIASAGGLLAVASRSLNAGKMPNRKAEIPFGAFLAPAIWLAFMLERSDVLKF